MMNFVFKMMCFVFKMMIFNDEFEFKFEFEGG